VPATGPADTSVALMSDSFDQKEDGLTPVLAWSVLRPPVQSTGAVRPTYPPYTEKRRRRDGKADIETAWVVSEVNDILSRLLQLHCETSTAAE
jgi:hypothetical protein